MNRDEAFQEYEEALALIDEKANRAREEVRTAFREQLRSLRDKAHEELKAIRAIDQKTKRTRR